MSDTKVAVAEQFYTLQGEGPYVGQPAVFLRLAGCNLACGATETDLQDVDEDHTPDGDATWRCDTIEVWREADQAPTPEELVSQWKENGFLEKIDNGAHIVLTGGEPTLPKHQEAFKEVYAQMLEEGVSPFVEVETNGTQKLDYSFKEYVDQFNVSCKLSNSGHDYEERINPKALRQYVGYEYATFKFVVSREKDIEEIKELQEEFKINPSQIMLMPAGYTRDDLDDTYQSVAELCKEENYRFSQRLHVNLWGMATGV